MRGFVVGWVVAFSLVGLGALGIGSALGPAPPRAAGPAPPPVSVEAVPTAAPFTQDAALDVVAGRLASTSKGAQFRLELRRSAQVTYHSADHWTIRWGPASWTAHGPGRYAEPDNEAARRLEAEAAIPL